jgi:hypothetical protein
MKNTTGAQTRCGAVRCDALRCESNNSIHLSIVQSESQGFQAVGRRRRRRIFWQSERRMRLERKVTLSRGLGRT